MFLKWIAAQFDPQPDSNEIHIPFGYKRGFYQSFLEYWIDEVEGGINEQVESFVFQADLFPLPPPPPSPKLTQVALPAPL
jgi:hypothetical protein